MLNYISKYIFYLQVLNKISIEKNRFWRYLPLKIILKNGNCSNINKSIFKTKLEYILGEFNNQMFNFVENETKHCIKEHADQVLNHNFNLLGSGIVYLNPIDWHKDFKSGYKWNKGKFYKNYIKTDLANNADVKVPWELSRCHHLLWLGETYLLTNEENYAIEIVTQIKNWIKENPLMYSVNWTCSMDVAIRAVNWMFAINMIIKSEYVNEEFIKIIYNSLYEHGFYIYNNLEKSIPYSANHYASNLAGLLYLGQLFINTKKGKKWWNFSLREYYSEVRMQILPSGVHYEKSISYHRLTTELFSYPIFMINRVGENIPMDILSRLKSMYKFISDYLKPNGKSPMVGDNDDGRFLPFVPYEFFKHGYLLDNLSLDNIIINNGIKQLFINKSFPKKSIMHDGGFAILRMDDAYLFISNSGQSKYPLRKISIGTHTHNDLLSFEFSIGNDDVFIDPGTFVYTSDIKKRNEFRSTWKHNTIVVDSEEQNILSNINAFTIDKNSIIGKNQLNIRSGNEEFIGTYTTIVGQMSHYRQFNLSFNKLIIIDKINKSGKDHYGSFYLHFAENLNPILKDGKILVESRLYYIQILIDNINCYEISIIEDTISPSYGKLKHIKTLLVKFSFNFQTEITTCMTWHKKEFSD